MRQIAAQLCLLTFMVGITSADTGTDTLEGIYAVSGQDDAGGYTGSATIRVRGDGYLVQIATTSFDENGNIFGVGSVNGLGMKHGDKLSVAWKQGDRVIGLTVYTIKKDTLSGRWLTFPGGTNTKGETLKKIGALPKRDKDS